MKYRYSVQFINEHGEWQEDDVFQDVDEADEHKTKVEARESKEVKVIDLESRLDKDEYY